MKLFIKPYILEESYLYYYGNLLTSLLEKLDNYYLVKSQIFADLAIIQIGDLNDLLDIPKISCVLYFHFKPIESEYQLIEDLLTKRNDLLIISPYNISLANIDKNRIIINPFAMSLDYQDNQDNQDNQDKIHIYYHSSIQENDLVEINKKTGSLNCSTTLYSFNNLKQDIDYQSNQPFAIILENKWDNLFNHQIIEALELGAIPILMKSQDMGLYNKYLLDYSTFQEKFNKNEKDLGINYLDLDLEKFSYQSHLHILREAFNYLTNNSLVKETINKADKFIFIPFLDMLDNDNNDDNDDNDNNDNNHKEQEKIDINNDEEVILKCTGKYKAISSNGYLREFYPWGLSHCYTDPNQGILVKASIYQQYLLPIETINGYTSYPLMSYKFTNQTKIKDITINNDSITTHNPLVISQEGLTSSSLIPFHRWNFDINNCTYLKNPISNHQVILVTYIESDEEIPFLKVNLDNLSELNCKLPIYVYYRQCLIDRYQDILSTLPTISTNIILINLDNEIESGILDKNRIMPLLYSLLLSEAEIIFYFKSTSLFLGNPEKCLDLDELSDSLFFISSNNENNYQENIDYKNWCLLNITSKDNTADVSLSANFFIYQRKLDWHSLLISMGLVEEKFINILNISSLLKLGLLANNKKMGLVKSCELGAIGIIHDNLFIGSVTRKWKGVLFLKIPLWIRINRVTHIIVLLENISWYYESLMASIISSDKNATKIIETNKIITVIDKIRKICN